MQASIVLAYIGLACSCILIAALIIFAIVDFKSVNRVTVRLVVGIAIADVLTHVSGIVTIGTKPLLGTPYCEFLAALATLDRHLYAFTNIAISCHLYRAIVLLKKPSFKSELTIWIVLVVLIAILMVIYYFMGTFSGKINKNACNPGADNPVITKIVFGLIGFFNFLAIISGIIVTIVGHRYLEKWIETYSTRKLSNNTDQRNFKAAKLKATKRSFLYPLSAVITLTMEVVLCFWMVVIGNPPAFMFFINGVMLGFKGILTLITFSLDQAVWNSVKATYAKLSDIHMDNMQL